jgi:hexulose-6-phosphate isomerase
MGEIGFMQGRLCEPIDGQIQAFPWDHWQEEFPLANRLGFRLMEWTLDREALYDNPIMTVEGRDQIGSLCETHGVTIGSLTGDCFMQAPFHKAPAGRKDTLLADVEAVVDACGKLGARYVVVPLVDNGSLETARQEVELRDGLLPLTPALCDLHIKLVFESDFAPRRLAAFIEQFPPAAFGINYDIGNSAALGFDPAEEIGCYGARIGNVHVKDRVLGGTTVPLGEGNADFPKVFHALKRVGYCGDFILQTARAADGNHAGVLCRYREMVRNWWSAYEARA